MCGVTGWFDPKPQSKEILERMTMGLFHRGPDSSGLYHQGPIAMGHRRLAIIDLNKSHQPMMSQEGRYVLTYNGELYNFQDLRQELEELGHKFYTKGDTEVLLAALIQWKEAALLKLQGMFAFAFWDAQEELLLLARDSFGIKPLYICQNENSLFFSSELKSLLLHPAVSSEIDPNAIGLYLECQFIPTPFTPFLKIRKLPAAHFLCMKKGHIEQKRYWTPSYLPKFEFDEKTAMQRLEAELQRSVRSMLIADVPLGVFVSGGIDSSLIAALVQEVSGKKAKIFSIGFNDIHNEHEHAARIAQFLGAEFYPLVIQAEDMIGALDHMPDEPLGDQAVLPTLLLSKLARHHVKVVLTGEGADEVFAGYSNYAKRLQEAPLCERWRFARFLYPFMPTKLRKNRLVKALARPISRRYSTIPTLFDSEMHKNLLTADFYAAQKVSLESIAEAHYFACNSNAYLDRMLHIDQSLWLADDLLMKVDHATMAYSLEARVPYLDHKLVEFAARLPAHFKLRKNVGKYLLKKVAANGLLPPEIIDRPKWGLTLPLHKWMAEELKPLIDDSLNSLLSRNLFRSNLKRRNLHASRLFALLSLELMLRRYAPNYRYG